MAKTVTPSPFAPRGWHTITPRLVAHDAAGRVKFLKRVFGATGEYRRDVPSVVRIGDSAVMISDADVRKPTTAFLYVYVKDADATYRRAMEAEARSLEEPSDMPYGDRRCMLEDKWGNIWQVATYGKRRVIGRRSPQVGRAGPQRVRADEHADLSAESQHMSDR